jgi:hypothetical protein
MSQPNLRAFSVETLEPLILMSASAIDSEIDGTVSVIAIDLNDDGEIGITGQTTGKDKSGITEIGPTVQFDVDADSKADSLQWFDGSGDGILVDIAKIQGNKIDGDALFGNEGGEFQSGFDKLADFDKDGNHRLDGDEISRLRLWVDDGNGQLDSGELHKLSDHNIFSLSVRATENSGLSQSWAFTEDDSQLIIEDVWFVVTDASVSEDEQSDEPPVAMNHPLRWTMLP